MDSSVLRLKIVKSVEKSGYIKDKVGGLKDNMRKDIKARNSLTHLKQFSIHSHEDDHCHCHRT